MKKGRRNPNWRGGKIKKRCVCGKFFFKFPSQFYDGRKHFCSPSCRSRYSTGIEKLGVSNRGRKLVGKYKYFTGSHVNGNGYRMVYKPDHPNTNPKGYILEHRLVLEKHLGRLLERKEVVHHKNHNRLDNRISNLELMASASEHSKKEHLYWKKHLSACNCKCHKNLRA